MPTLLLHPPNLFEDVKSSVAGRLRRRGGEERAAADVVAARVQAAIDAQQLTGVEFTTITSHRSAMGDLAAEAFFARFCDSSCMLGASVTWLDLSYSALSIAAWRRCVRPLLDNGLELPYLETCNLTGNFRSELGNYRYAAATSSTASSSEIHNGTNSAAATTDRAAELSDDIVCVWASHPSLTLVTVDPWIESAEFASLRKRRALLSRERAMARRTESKRSGGASSSVGVVRPATQVGPSLWSTARASTAASGAGPVPANRQSVFVVPDQEVDSRLYRAALRALGAAENDLAAQITDVFTEGSPQPVVVDHELLVELQLLEHRYRDKLSRSEDAAWLLVSREMGARWGAAAKTAAWDRQCSRQVRAMEDLEGEMRDMISQREEDTRRKLRSKWAKYAARS